MWGMCNADTPYIVLAMLTDIGSIGIVPDRSHQGILNHLMVVKLMRGAFANDASVFVDGRSVLDPDRAYYWGISQGGILVCAHKPPSSSPTAIPLRTGAHGERLGVRSRALARCAH